MKKVKQIVKQRGVIGVTTKRAMVNSEAKFGVPGESRTHDLLLRRQPLYPLSYRDIYAISI